MELTIEGNQYVVTGKLDAFTQLHIARRLGSVLPVVDGLVANANADKDKSILMVMMLSHISDDDTDYVIKKCLSVIGRRQENVTSRVQTNDGKLMFDDISVAALLELTTVVIEENLGDFFRTALANLEQEKQKVSV